MIDGKNYYEQSSPPMRAQLLGDYHFQPFKTKFFRDIDKRFIRYATTKIAGEKPRLLYAAHTIVQIYYSTVCLQYKTSSADTMIIEDIKLKLKESLNIKAPKFDKMRYGSKDVYKLKYQTTNTLNRIGATHTEYFFRNGEYIYRLFFWTLNNDDTVICEEAEFIIKEIKFP